MSNKISNAEKSINNIDRDLTNCFIIKNLDVLEKKWSIKILLAILKGEKHFNSIQRRLKKITPKMLSLRLKELEERGLISKRMNENNKIEYIIPFHIHKNLECTNYMKSKI
ncbi:MAG: helix-turn-helix domain-containing protein [Candidatus Anstonellales archaeon]